MSDLIRWFVAQLRDAAQAAGRDPKEIKVMAAAPAHVGDLAMCRDRVRWFPALVSTTSSTWSTATTRGPAAALTGYVRDREGYDYLHHAEVGSSNASFVDDDVVDRFSVIGPVGGARRQAARVGRRRRRPVQHLPDERRRGADARIYGREIIPALS